MSALLAAGWARSRSQSVSVVPMIQCWCHGMTNSRLVLVRVIRPQPASIRSRGTSRWTPLEARTRNDFAGCSPVGASIRASSSIQTPAALITVRARTSISRPDSRSRTLTPATRPPMPLAGPVWSARKPTTRVLLATAAPKWAAVRDSIMVCRASSTCPS